VTINPWRLLSGAWPMTLEWAHLPPGERGRLYPRLSVLLLDPRLGQAEQRCTLAHELAHWILDHEHCEGRRSLARLERETEQFAARWLIDIEQLVRAEQWSRHDDEVAEELWVDACMLRARRAGFTGEEQAYIEQRRDASREWGAA
jgi:hypothetical protein